MRKIVTKEIPCFIVTKPLQEASVRRSEKCTFAWEPRFYDFPSRLWGLVGLLRDAVAAMLKDGLFLKGFLISFFENFLLVLPNQYGCKSRD